jgi:hypothetical protein
MKATGEKRNKKGRMNTKRIDATGKQEKLYERYKKRKKAANEVEKLGRRDIESTGEEKN